jgi:hypothetical protein
MGTGTLTELKSALQSHVSAMDTIGNAFRIEGENVSVTTEQASDFRKHLAEAEKIKGHIEAMEQAAELKAWGSAPVGGSVAAAVEAGVRGAMYAGEAKSLGELFTASEEFKSMKESGAPRMDRPFSLETTDLGSFGQRKDVYTASAPVQTTRGFGQTQFDPMVPRNNRTARVRDLFPVASTSANLIDFFRVIGFGANRLDLTTGAATVRERAGADGISAGNVTFGLKPKSNLTFESAQAPVRTIAHYEVAHRNVLDDEPQLQSVINNELLYGLRLEEDDQILNGDGTGENLLGLLNTPNIQLYTQASTGSGATLVVQETKADALRRAATKASLAYYQASGYVLHPFDWEDVELTKTSQGAYVLVTNVAVGAQTTAWRQPVVESPAIAEKTFVTGAWGLGAQLYDRAQASIRVADQHADFFIRNAVAVLAEQRLAFAVKRPESFVKGTFLE